MYLHMYMENITCTRKIKRPNKNPNFSAHTKIPFANNKLLFSNPPRLPSLPPFLPPFSPSLPTDTTSVQSRVCAHAV